MRSSLDANDLRRALGQFPTGVTVITTLDAQSEPVGITVSSFNTVSLRPPLILWSMAKSGYSAKIFENTEYFAVNVLGEQQVELSDSFARQSSNKFDDVTFSSGKRGSPLLENTAASFECKTWKLYDGGDHTIIVGEVLDFQVNNSVMPLVFSRGNYVI